jgi:protein gp37
MKNSSIQWTDHTWNIARGCTKVDADCKYCYMYRDSMNGTRYDPIQIIKTKTVFNLPLKIKEPSKIFTCSLTDFFHPAIDEYRHEAWDIIRQSPQHTFQILTKRPERILECLPSDWGNGYENVWLGTSVGSTSKQGIKRIKDLIAVKDKFKIGIIFLSLEPLHDQVDLIIHNEMLDYNMLGSIDWVIVGGESGNNIGKYQYRPCKLEWIEDIVTDCQNNSIPVFVKQLGTHLAKKLNLSDRHGSNIEEFPQSLQVRQFPNFK